MSRGQLKNHHSPHLQSGPLPETLERIRMVSGLRSKQGFRDWLNRLEMTRHQYRDFLEGRVSLSESAIQNLAHFIGADPATLERDTVNFREVAIRFSRNRNQMPERYSVAAFGRKRTPITSLDYLEKALGWRARTDVLNRFELSESMLISKMEAVNVQLISDVTAYLASQGLDDRFFVDMGIHSAAANSQTVLDEVYSSSHGPRELYEHMFGDMVKYYEQNCTYSIRKLTSTYCELEVASNDDIATALNVRSLGNWQFCLVKAGIMVSGPRFLNQTDAVVHHYECVHHGASVCKFHVDFSNVRPLS